MPHSVTLITTLTAALGLALVLGFAATRLKLPALVGYLIAGVLARRILRRHGPLVSCRRAIKHWPAPYAAE